ncbi:MAG TPA: glycosyltransferase [Paenibacillus sp.]|nr:glycosyltransferase [Paenibacillus sp.]
MKGTFRILLAMSNFRIGGVQTYTYTVAQTLLEFGVPVTVFVSEPTGPLLKRFVELGCDVRADGGGDAAALARALADEKVGLINAHHTSVALRLSEAAARAGIPLVGTVHHRGGGVLAMKGAVQRFVAVSPPLQLWLRTSGGIEADVVPNPIDTERFRDRGAAARAAFGIEPGAPVLAYAGRLTRKKGAIGRLVLETFEQELATTFPNARLLIAGDGDDAAELATLAIRSKVAGRIHCLGYVEDMPSFYSAANVVVGTGRVALEAMSCERVVVAVGVKGDAGLVTPPLYEYAWRNYYGDHAADWRATAEAIAASARIALASPALQREWGRQAREETVMRFDRYAVGRSLLALYERVKAEGGIR